MIVADTSALISLAIVDCLDLVVAEYAVHTTEEVLTELEDTAAYDDVHGRGARQVLDQRDGFTVHTVTEDIPETSRIDAGEGSCAVLADQIDAAFLLTDDLRALPELQQLTSATIAISPIMLKALVTREVLDAGEARDRVDRLAADRDWLGAPIYRRAKHLFEAD